MWVDLDDRKRPKTVPQLPEWATPAGWIRGLRPGSPGRGPNDDPKATNSAADEKLANEIEALSQTLGRGLYRGLLRDFARVWNPNEIHDAVTQKKVLQYMHAAQRGLQRLEAVLERTGHKALIPILDSMGFKSLERVDNLQALKEIVLHLENTADLNPQS